MPSAVSGLQPSALLLTSTYATRCSPSARSRIVTTSSRIASSRATILSKGWNASGVTKKYAWYANGELIQFSTSNKLKLTWEEKGAVITVEVVGSKQGYVKVTSPLSNPTGVIK